MRYFSYFGKSCLDVLGVNNPLVLVSLDGAVDEVTGSEKKVITGDTSIYRTVANEYGNMYDDVLEFEYTLIKFNDEVITPNEQRMIETWLTSPKLSQYLQLFDVNCRDGEIVDMPSPKEIYCGTFTSTEWITCNGGYAGVTFTFQCDSPYAWQFYDNKRYAVGEYESDIFVTTDDTQDYVYPKITFKALNDGEEPILHDVSFEFINKSDSNKSFKMVTQIDKTIVMDCKSCRVTDNAGNLFSYDDLGWQDVGNIYWPRFINGYNDIAVNVDDGVTLEIRISYMSPKKIVGGWL